MRCNLTDIPSHTLQLFGNAAVLILLSVRTFLRVTAFCLISGKSLNALQRCMVKQYSLSGLEYLHQG